MKNRHARFFPLLLMLVGVLAYANSFHGVLVYDDYLRILRDTNIRHFHLSMLNTTRPLVGLTLYFNYICGGLNPADYHALNLAIHIIAGLLLFGIVRRTLGEIRGQTLYTGSVPRWTTGSVPAWLAGFVAAIWLVHPLQTESVTYVIQRAESLMGMFYLLTLYCVIRGIHSPKPRRWYAAAIVSCALGMTSKPVMVTAPLMVLLYDRFFISKSFLKALRGRRSLYAGLAGTWIVLIVLLSVPHESATTAGFKANLISPVRYLLTQQGVILHYLKLSFWPRSLCLDYAWPAAKTAGEILTPGLLVVLLFLSSLWAGIRCHPFGFIGLWFFITLAPSSSIVPIADYAAEHRMYLPLAAVAAGTVVGMHNLIGRVLDRYAVSRRSAGFLTAGIALIALAILTCATHHRNKDYCSEEILWRSVVAQRPGNFRAQQNLCSALYLAEKYEETINTCKEGLNRLPDFANVRHDEILQKGNERGGRALFGQVFNYAGLHNTLGLALRAQGRPDEAGKHFAEAVRLTPGNSGARSNLAAVLFELGHTDEAIKHWRYLLAVSPDDPLMHQCLGEALLSIGNINGAVEHYNAVLKLEPDHVFVQNRLAWILATSPDNGLRNGHRAMALAEKAVKAVDYKSARAFDVLAAAYAEAGEFEKAVKTARRAIQLAEEGGETGITRRLELYLKGVPYRDTGAIGD